MIKYMYFFTVFVFSVFCLADLQVSHDEQDCIDGWSSMDVFVSFSQESFEFDPPCGSSFNKSFTTMEGETCRVEAGMCSSFEPKNRLVVTCKSGDTAKIDIQCPKK